MSEFVSTISTTPLNDFMNEQYVALRCAQDHAKLGEAHFLPATLDDRLTVQSALYQLARFLQAALAQLTGIVPAGGTTTFAGIKMYNDVLEDLTLYVSSDPTPERPSDTQISPLGRPVSELTTTYLQAVDAQGYDYGWQGVIPVADLQEPLVCTTAGRVGDVLYSRGTVTSTDVTGADVFQYRQVQYWSSNGGIKRHYPL